MNLTYDDLDSRISKAFSDKDDGGRRAICELRELAWSREGKQTGADKGGDKIREVFNKIIYRLDTDSAREYPECALDDIREMANAFLLATGRAEL